MNTVSGYYFDTYNVITADADEDLLQEALNSCAIFEHELNRWEEGSDVWLINQNKEQPTKVSDDTVRILRTAEAVREVSCGAFNVLVGDLVNLWNFKNQDPQLPDPVLLEQEVQEAADSFYSIHGNKASLYGEGSMDLGGIAKGYITDRIADFLRKKGVQHALLNFGGNIVTIGPKEDGTPWTIGLQTPDGERQKDYWAAVTSVDSTVVTSGVYERGFEKNGKWYHHILDPKTGYPVENNLLTVTIVAKDSMMADALATAAFVMGPERGLPMVHKMGAKAVFLDKAGNVWRSPDLELIY